MPTLPTQDVLPKAVPVAPLPLPIATGLRVQWWPNALEDPVMTEQRDALADLIAACLKDEALKARFLADPKAVLAEHGIETPAHIDVKVVENSDDTVYITLPVANESDDLSDEDLSSAAGGSIMFVLCPGPPCACKGTSH